MSDFTDMEQFKHYSRADPNWMLCKSLSQIGTVSLTQAQSKAATSTPR